VRGGAVVFRRRPPVCVWQAVQWRVRGRVVCKPAAGRFVRQKNLHAFNQDGPHVCPSPATRRSAQCVGKQDANGWGRGRGGGSCSPRLRQRGATGGCGGERSGTARRKMSTKRCRPPAGGAERRRQVQRAVGRCVYGIHEEVVSGSAEARQAGEVAVFESSAGGRGWRRR